MSSNLTSPRGVLTARDINTPSSPRKTGTAFPPREPTKLSHNSTAAQEKPIAPARPQSSSRREAEASDTEVDTRASKRARTESYTAPADIRTMALAGLAQERANSVLEDVTSAPISTDTSPASAFVSRTDGLNERWNTTFSESDDMRSSFSRPTVHKLSQGEARQKAEALKLRLRLASYRVFTNQITTPWKDLEARTMPLGTLRTSHSSPASSFSSHPNQSSQSQEAIPITIPYPRSKAPSVAMASSPPSGSGYTYTRAGSAPDDGTSTRIPAPPRQHDAGGVTSSPSVADREGQREADSAAKMELATAGLLSLMRQQEARMV